jgi:hypothetical protein
MKYAEVNGHTFHHKFNDENDAGGIGLLVESVAPSEGGAQSVDDMIKHPKLMLGETELREFTVYGCPVCKNVYFKKEHAEHCADGEKELARIFAGVKIGDWLKYEKTQPERLDIWSGSSIGDVYFVQVTRLSYCYDGFSCGSILTIHYSDGGFINAGDTLRLSFWSKSSESEKNEYELRRKREDIERKKAELEAMETSLK